MKRGTALLLASWACGLLGCTGQRQVEAIRLGHGLDSSHPVHRAMVFLGERLRELSDGSLRLEIYPSEQLGSERECLELLQIGSLGMTKVSASVLEGFAPSFRVLGLPYLFRDRAHRFAVLDGAIGRRLLLSAEPKRLRGLCFYDAGSRSFYTRTRPIVTPDDLAGLKVRTQESATAIAMVKALGGNPTPLSWGELYTALQQGVVDAAENNPPSYRLSRHFEVAPFFSLDEHTAVPDVVLVGTALWQRLDEQQRVWLQRAADESAEHQRKIWQEAEDEALAFVQEKGVTVTRPEKGAFEAKAHALFETYRDDPEIWPLIEEITRSRPPSP